MSDNEKPLVTFALFAYNQEQFIREAVEGAFAQTYEPLEIILSDDCSSDRTFEIMQEMAAAYRGPHQVRVRRQKENSGVLAHLLCTAREASGEVFVVAAGDDISLPERTEILASQFGSDDIYGVSSDDIIIDEHGIVREWNPDRITQRNIWHAQSQTWLHGATAAYRSSFLKLLPIPDIRVYFEDIAFRHALELIGKKAIRLHSSLIKYRYHFSNISNSRNFDLSVDAVENASIVRWRRIADTKAYCIELAKYLPSDMAMAAPEFLCRLLREQKYLELLSDWKLLSFQNKAELLFLALRRGEIKVALTRLFGLNVFYFLKKIKALFVR